MTTTTAVPSKLTLVNCNEFRKGNYLASLSNGTLTCHITLMHFPRIIHYDLSLERRKLELLYLVLLIG